MDMSVLSSSPILRSNFILLYASYIEGMKYKAIESAHQCVCKKFSNVSPQTWHNDLWSNRQIPLVSRQFHQCSKVLVSDKEMTLSRNPKHAHVTKANKRYACAGNFSKCNNWVYGGANWLDRFRFWKVRMNGGFVSSKTFLRSFRHRMIDCFQTGLGKKVNFSDRYKTYRWYLFKSLLHPEK